MICPNCGRELIYLSCSPRGIIELYGCNNDNCLILEIAIKSDDPKDSLARQGVIMRGEQMGQLEVEADGRKK